MLTFNYITFAINIVAIITCGASAVVNTMNASYDIAATMGLLSLVNLMFAIQTFQRITVLRDEK